MKKCAFSLILILIALQGCGTKTIKTDVLDMNRSEQLKSVTSEYRNTGVNISAGLTAGEFVYKLSLATKIDYFLPEIYRERKVPRYRKTIHTLDEFNEFMEIAGTWKLVEKRGRYIKGGMVELDLIETRYADGIQKFKDTKLNIELEPGGLIRAPQLFSFLENRVGYSIEGYERDDNLTSSFFGDAESFLQTYYPETRNKYVRFDHENHLIKFEDYQTRIFQLKIPAEKYEKETSMKVAGTSTNMDGADSDDEDTYNQMTITETLDFGDESISAFLKKAIPAESSDEHYNWSKADTILTVSTTRDKMEKIERVVNRLNEQYGKQIAISITFFQIEEYKNSKMGVNWSYIEDIVDGGVTKSLTLGTASSTYTSGNTLESPGIFKLGADQHLGMLLSALNEFGDVSTSNRISMIGNNHVPNIKTLNIKEFFVDSWEISTDDDDDTSAPEQSQIQYGLYMYVKPVIIGNEVKLTINASINSKISIEELEFGTDGEYKLQQPKLLENLFNETITLNEGEKLVVSGIMQKAKSWDYSGMAPEEAGLFRRLLGLDENEYSSREIGMYITVSEIR